MTTKLTLDDITKFVKNWWLVILIGLSVLSIGFSIFYYYHQINSVRISSTEDLASMAAYLGTRGDYYGGILNPIFAFFSFIALIYTVHLQIKELGLSREEFRKSVSTQEKSEKALSQQAFENTFFNMLSLHNEITKNIELDADDLVDLIFNKEHHKDEFKGRILNLSRDHTMVKSHKLNAKTNRQAISFIAKIISFKNDAYDTPKKRYKKIQDNRNDILGHYFRNLFQIMKFVDEYNDVELGKTKYTKLLRAQLSSFELVVLFFNCLENVVDNGEFAALLIKYEILKHIKINYNEYRKSASIDVAPIETKDLIQYVIKDNVAIVKSAFGDNAGFKNVI